jgi:hypothetical protein
MTSQLMALTDCGDRLLFGLYKPFKVGSNLILILIPKLSQQSVPPRNHNKFRRISTEPQHSQHSQHQLGRLEK